MYAQVRHPWRTRPVRVIPKGRTCASGSQHFAVLCLSATFDTTLAGTQQVHPCMLNCAILGAQACTRYTERPNRSEEHTSELQSRPHLVCRLLLEKKNTASTY